MSDIPKAATATATSPPTTQSVLCLGGTNGIGRGLAIASAESGAQVIVVGRNEELAKGVVEKLRNINPDADHKYYLMDMSVTSRIDEKMAGLMDVIRTCRPLTTICLTPGIGTTDGLKPTEDGVDQKLAVHFYGRLRVLNHLLPLLRENGGTNDVRILSVLSGSVHSPYKSFKEDPTLRDHFSIQNAANAAGFYTDLALNYLAKKEENKNITFFHLAPGIVASNWGKEMVWYLRGPIRLLQAVIGEDTVKNARKLLKAVRDPSRNGGYFAMKAPFTKSQLCDEQWQNEENEQWAWDHLLDVWNGTYRL